MDSERDMEMSSRQQRRDGEGEGDEQSSEKRSRRDQPDKDRRHHHDRSRYRSRDRRDRRRSKSPNTSSRRTRSQDRRRDRSRERDGGERARRRSRDGTKHRRREDKHISREKDDGKEEKGREGNARSVVKRDGPLPSQEASWAVTNGEEPEKPKEQRNFGTSGLLAAASNSVQQADGTSITLKYHEPADARKPSPKDVWKLYVFKGEDVVDTIDLGARSCWLVGRDIAVVDLRAEHPSISKQHAVLQFRYIEKRNEFGDKTGKVKPYIIDLESANGTILNGEKIPDSRYLELRHKDMVQFGESTREYVVMLAPRN